MTDQERAAMIKALLAERVGYVRRGLPVRVAAVDEQLRMLGHGGTPPVARASKRPGARGVRRG